MIVLEMFIAMIAGLLLPHTEPTKEDAPEKVENTEPAGTIHEETAEVAVGEQVEQDRRGTEESAEVAVGEQVEQDNKNHEESAANAAKKSKKKTKAVEEEVDVDIDMFSDKCITLCLFTWPKVL